MNRVGKYLVLAALLAQGCGEVDEPGKVILEGDNTIPPGKAVGRRVTLVRTGSWKLKIAPEQGDLEAWLALCDPAPDFIVDERVPLPPQAKRFRSGRADSDEGIYTRWADYYLILVNRGKDPVKARVKLTVVEDPPKRLGD